MDHQDLQVVANMYQISIHILTTYIEGNEVPYGRWSPLASDSRLESFSAVKFDLPDMWLVHVDNIHFDLIVK